MSALHRLKAYFGMVPAEEFDAAAFDPMEFDSMECGPEGFASRFAPGFEDSEFDRRFNRVAAPTASTRRSHRVASDGYDDDLATLAGDHAAIGTCPTRSPSWAAESRVMGSRITGSRAADSWTAETAVRGSLAIDTATIDAGSINARPTGRHLAAPQRFAPVPGTGSPIEDPFMENSAHPLARIVTLHPHNYNEARSIGERYREGNPVIINLTEMADRDAKRLVDFAAGLAFALRGSIDKVTNKVFLLSPPNVDVSAEDRRRIAEGRFFV